MGGVTPDPIVTAFEAAEAMTTEQAGQRLAELMWYANHNILLPDSEVAEVVTLAAKLDVRLAWRHMVLSEGVWREGRYGEATPLMPPGPTEAGTHSHRQRRAQ